MRRIAVVVIVVFASILGGMGTAFAGTPWGGVNCDQTPTPACQLGAGSGGGQGGSGPIGGGQSGSGQSGSGQSGSGQSGSGTHQGSGRNGQPNNPGDQIIGGGGNLANCSYVPSNYQPPAGAITAATIRPLNPAGARTPTAVPVAYTLTAARAAAGPTPGQPGSWYVWKCTGPGVANAVYYPPIWIPIGKPAPGAPALPAPAQLAQIARSQLRLPTPTIAANPAGEQLVTVPTWLWLAGGWTRMSATASVPGVSVTAVATPASVAWSMGDGATVTCAGAGTPFPTGGDPRAVSPTCGYTYPTSSAGQPNHRFAVTATVHWSITWSGAGQAGAFPDMTTQAAAAFPVAEAQALNTGPG
jgi:hypothetical protein